MNALSSALQGILSDPVCRTARALPPCGGLGALVISGPDLVARQFVKVW